tara:strand:+ start:419 stop:538 length:120 start_codon:yes stop_codon:yes gene_type:complete
MEDNKERKTNNTAESKDAKKIAKQLFKNLKKKRSKKKKD